MVNKMRYFPWIGALVMVLLVGVLAAACGESATPEATQSAPGSAATATPQPPGSGEDPATPTPAGESRLGGIAGIVTDLDGGPVEGMRVGIVSGTAAFPEIGPETDEAGSYQINSVPPGTFQVGVHDRDGQRVGLESVVVKSGETATLNFSVSTDVAGEKQAPLPPLPVMRLHHAGRVYDGVQGSYCWPVGRTGEGYVEKVCADKFRWETLGAPIPVEAGDNVTIEIEAEEPPQELSASFYELDSDSAVRFTTLGPGPKASLPVDLPSGVYNIRVVGQWAMGDMAYQFQVEVRPEPSAKSKEPTEGLCLPAAALGVSVGDTWTISGPVKLPEGFPTELPGGAAEVSMTFTVDAIGTTTYAGGGGDAPIEHPTVQLKVTNVTRDADGNVLSTEDDPRVARGISWTPASVMNLGPALTPDWECHEKAWLNGWPPPAQPSIGERVLSSGVTAVVFTVRQPLLVPDQGIDATTERHHGYDKLTGRAVLQEFRTTGTRNGAPFNMEMLMELTPAD